VAGTDEIDGHSATAIIIIIIIMFGVALPGAVIRYTLVL